jgi:hypothetical protein
MKQHKVATLLVSALLVLSSFSRAQTEQPNEIVCSSKTACKKGHVPVFVTNGGSASVKDSLITQGGGAVKVTGNLSVTEDVNTPGNVSAATVTTVNSSGGVNSTMSGTGNRIAAVEGTASATGAAGFTFGVIGQSASDQGRGVFGLASGATGVGVIGESSGTSGIGVVGKDLNGGGLGFLSQGHASQNRTGGGWIKALMYVNTKDAPYSILRCFNSTMTGTAATTPPCGYTLTELGPGNFTIDIGFEVDDRFVSATVNGNPAAPSVLIAPNNHTLNIIWYDLFAGGIRGEYYWVAIY